MKKNREEDEKEQRRMEKNERRWTRKEWMDKQKVEMRMEKDRT